MQESHITFLSYQTDYASKQHKFCSIKQDNARKQHTFSVPSQAMEKKRRFSTSSQK